MENIIKKNIKGLGGTVAGAAAYLLATASNVFADSEITSHSPGEIAQHIFKANSGLAAAFGGALIGIAVVMVGIKMLMDRKKEEARAEGMDTMLTIIFAAVIIGGFAIFAGVFFGLGQ